MPILGRLIVQSINRELPDNLAAIWTYKPVRGRKDESRSFSTFQRLEPANGARL